jgi:K+-sensing histidine kinase KdpD
MVCVTNQKTSSRLIFKGNDTRENKNDKLFIVHIINKKDRVLYGNDDGEALEYLFDLAKQKDAELIVQRSDNTEKSLIQVANNIEATHIVLGKSNNSNRLDLHKKLSKNLKDIQIIID